MVLTGIFNVTIAVANVTGEVFEEIEATVDTACDYTTLPREMGNVAVAGRCGER